MAAAVKFQDFVEQMARGIHDWDNHTFKVFLTNSTPNAASNTVKADLTEVSAGNGYTAGGNATTITVSETGGTATVAGTSPATWTASGGTIGPFRYAVLYNDSATNDNLVCYWDYGASVTLNAGETFTAAFGSSIFTMT